MTTDGVTQMQQNLMRTWTKQMQDHMTRMHGLVEDVMRLERESISRFDQAVDEMAKITKESVRYSLQLQSEWRKLAVEASRQASSIAQP